MEIAFFELWLQQGPTKTHPTNRGRNWKWFRFKQNLTLQLPLGSAEWGMVQQGPVKSRTFYTFFLSNLSQRKTDPRSTFASLSENSGIHRYFIAWYIPAPSLQTPARKEHLAQMGVCACSILLIICKPHTSKAVILKHGQCTINLFLITKLYFGLAIKTAAVMNLCGCRCSHMKN